MGIIGYGYGSEWHLTQYMARRRNAFTRLVEERLGLAGLVWLDHDEFRDRRSGELTLGEPRGLSFLPVDHTARQDWERLWPQTGNVPNWDAVAQAPGGQGPWILVEAKAHTGELASSCGATSDASRTRIAEVLRQTQQQLGADDSRDWLSGYYQYCNRLALLHFLRERGVDARLLFLYFTGDRTDLGARGRNCPQDEEAWRAALAAQKRHVGLPLDAPVLAHVHQMFLPTYRVAISGGAAGASDLKR